MSTEGGVLEPHIADYYRVVRRRKWWIVVPAVVCLAAALGYAESQPKEYTATATLLVQSAVNPASTTGAPVGTVSSQQIQTDQSLVNSPPVRTTRPSQHHVGFAGVEYLFQHPEKGVPTVDLVKAPPVATSSSFTNDLIRISYTDRSPVRAESIANDYASAFTNYEGSIAYANGGQAVTLVRSQLGGIQGAITKLEKKATSASTPIAQALDGQIVALLNQETPLVSELVQLQINQNLSTGGVTVASYAQVPAAPSSPRPLRDAAEALLVGLLLGLVLAFVRESTDDSIRSKEDIERALPQVLTLGVVLTVDTWRESDRPYLTTIQEPFSPVTESYRSLRTALQFLRIDRDLRSIVVTSTGPGEGKTTTVANLAVVMAKAGQNVLVVSADLRRPRLGNFLAADDEVGLTSLALGTATIPEAVRELSLVPGLWYLGTGPLPVEPAEFLSSPKVANIFAALRERFDTILIDTPPLLPVTDALVMARYADGLVPVIVQHQTRRRSLSRLRELTAQSNIPLIGVVLNQVPQTGPDSIGYGLGYGYGYGYSPNGPSENGKASQRRGSKQPTIR